MKELIFKLLTLDAIKVALKKYDVTVDHTSFSKVNQYTISFYENNENLFSIRICGGGEAYGYYYSGSKYSYDSEKEELTYYEFEQLEENLIDIKEYLDFLAIEEIKKYINEIIN